MLFIYLATLRKKIMSHVDILRNSIIDKLHTISNEEYLAALYQLVDNSSVNSNVVELTDEQILMLQLSEQDIEKGRLISQAELDKSDAKWLREM